MIGAILGDLWPFILAGLGALFGLFQLRRAGAEKARRKESDRRAETHRQMREFEDDASTQDDPALVDRLTRK
ncbi:hypothetical protein DVVG_00018 [Dunaliella viridis virus SI2]|uniref:hypothetical protein n=1 Tax=Dunaliella viridis virus SI2 TaxID=754069 RepID=UPI0002C0D7F8|nr:hypothetical protein DVVG_00018 [Dunaliella viridis virus SI2]AGH16004.1 hypothetical protein DVVG_00018 [Dunaliella viridis virus SI2]